MNSIDINCDMGESFGHFQIGNDEAIFPLITSSNIACGFHGGDPLHMEQTIKLAIEHGVQIGAHPGFPDLAGFGRRKMELSQEELKANVKYQLAAIKGMAESLGTSVVYVKPHGALYNLAADSEEVSNTLIAGVMEIDQNLMIMGLAGSLFQEICLAQNLPFIAEAFADRCYQANGRLRSRSLDHSVITDPKQAAQQVLDLVANQQVTTFDGTVISLEAQSICVHGDNDKAVEILMSIDEVLTANRIQKEVFMSLEILPLGDQALIVNFEQTIDVEIHNQVIDLSKKIEDQNLSGITYLSPAYSSLTIGYDPSKTSFFQLRSEFLTLGKSDKKSVPIEGRHIKLPVCYQDPYAMDLALCAKTSGLSIKEIINIHTGSIFRVFMLGFLPGFPYLGIMPDNLQIPRKETPRIKVPERSVGIAGMQTGIYPFESPGGWNILGRTPVTMFDQNQKHPFLFNTGDLVEFLSISAPEYDYWKKGINKGSLSWEDLYD